MSVTKTHQKQTPTNEQHPRRPAPARPSSSGHPASFKRSVYALAVEIRAWTAGVLRRAGRMWRRTWTGRSLEVIVIADNDDDEDENETEMKMKITVGMQGVAGSAKSERCC